MRVAVGNARLVTPDGLRTGGALVENGVIKALGHLDLPDDAIDARGKHLVPGIVDLGVFTVDRAACRAGGIVRVAPMPDQSPVLDEPGAVQRLSLIGKPDLWIHPIAAATRGLRGEDKWDHLGGARGPAGDDEPGGRREWRFPSLRR